ncbi:MAG: alpha/beta hydrolase [Longimicrobiales bacterium]
MGRITTVDEHTVVVDGIPMRWLERGPGTTNTTTGDADGPAGADATGVPMIMVHGIPTSAELWRRVLPAVRGRAMAWEMVGYGASIPAGVGRDISVARQAGYLSSWLDALGIERAVLVGHDLGGGVVQRVALDRPEVCAGLVLTNAIGYDAWPVWPIKLAQRLHPVVGRVPDALMGRIFEAVLRRMHEPASLGSESARIHWGHYARHGGAAAFVRQARSLDVRDTLTVADRLPELDVPARVVWGDADPFLALEWGERFARDLGTELRIIPGALHFTPEDQPGPLAVAIAELTRS